MTEDETFEMLASISTARESAYREGFCFGALSALMLAALVAVLWSFATEGS